MLEILAFVPFFTGEVSQKPAYEFRADHFFTE